MKEIVSKWIFIKGTTPRLIAAAKSFEFGKKPVYFNLIPLLLNLKHMVLQEGQVYRLLPIELKHEGGVNTEAMYSNLMHTWRYQDLGNENIYYNHEDYQLRILQPTKSAYNTLASELMDEGKTEQAKKVVDFLYSNFIKVNIDLDMPLLTTTRLLFDLKEEVKAELLTDRLMKNARRQLARLEQQQKVHTRDGQVQLFMIRQLGEMIRELGYGDRSKKCSEIFAKYVNHQ